MEDYKRICFITNIGTHYRFPIFSAMSKDLKCDFYLGDHVETSIKTFDYNRLEGYRGTLKNKFFHHFYWQCKSIKLVFKPYQVYILDGEPYCLSSWVILILAKLKGKTTIAWTHGWYGRESILKAVIKKTFFSLHSKLMIYSEYAINLMKQEGIRADKMYCIANSLDTDKEKAIRDKMSKKDVYADHFHNNNPTLIYCGRIQKVKKLDLLLNAVKELRDKNIKTNVIIVGKDVDCVHIDDLIKSLALENQVWLFGPCYDDNIIAELFYNADACVSPGNVGLTAIHSLFFGCPVITHDNFSYQGPEFEAIQPGVTGDFFRKDDVCDLEEKIKKWIS
jgi:glycosyltransferase involved in cell wall biosynthesis